MWCKRCQQDVPGIADAEHGTACARCGAAMRTVRIDKASAGKNAGIDALAATALVDDAPTIDTWQLDEELSEAERLLKAFSPLTAVDANWPGAMLHPTGGSTRFDQVNRHTDSTSIRAQASGGFVAWLFLLAGTTALVCGGVLVGWSLYASRPSLCNLGLPFLLGGQAALLLGVVLQLLRFWQNHRAAAERLAQVDRQLGDLEQTTSLLGNTYGAGSSTFFAHLAEGASSHMLLADLKGQMDLLAMKMSRK
jgi:hypothetical protein